MGNRYTNTSLTKRQIDTLIRCRDKIDTIYRARYDIYKRSNNENEYVITQLMLAIDKLNRAINAAEGWVE